MKWLLNVWVSAHNLGCCGIPYTSHVSVQTQSIVKVYGCILAIPLHASDIRHHDLNVLALDLALPTIPETRRSAVPSNECHFVVLNAVLSMTLCVPLPPKQMEHKCCLEHKHYTLDMSFILTRGLSPRGYGCRPSPLAGIDSPCLTRKVLTTKLVNARTILVYLHDRHTSRN